MPRIRRLLHWQDWNPGLDNGHWTLGYVLSTLPGAQQDEIHWLVRLVENPRSRLALPGAISLGRHDAVHAVLGRGLMNQDEAFVIGFTMGAARRARRWHGWLFRALARGLYPPPYRFGHADDVAFRLGFAEARHHGARDLQDFPFEAHGDTRLADLRRDLGINVSRLHAAYRYERTLVPDTTASHRLDTDYGGVDPSDIVPPA